jgi:hypothetical protein
LPRDFRPLCFTTTIPTRPLIHELKYFWIFASAGFFFTKYVPFGFQIDSYSHCNNGGFFSYYIHNSYSKFPANEKYIAWRALTLFYNFTVLQHNLHRSNFIFCLRGIWVSRADSVSDMDFKKLAGNIISASIWWIGHFQVADTRWLRINGRVSNPAESTCDDFILMHI